MKITKNNFVLNTYLYTLKKLSFLNYFFAVVINENYKNFKTSVHSHSTIILTLFITIRIVLK